MSKLLIYGATGYTGQLIVRQAIDQGLKPILAGRSKDKVEKLANQHGLESRIFDLVVNEIKLHLEDIDVVIHAAGPYAYTAEPMLIACVETKTHYLDITGEIAIFEMSKKFDARAKEAGIMIMSGTGFDVVPTDCLAAKLHEQMPDATHLELAFFSKGGASSHGTSKTAIAGIGHGGSARIDGEIKQVRAAWKTKEIDFGPQKCLATTIPWGDVSTAYTSTGIPNIEVYMSVTPKLLRSVKLTRYLGWLLRSEGVIGFLQARVAQGPAGPTDEQRAKGISYVWGKATNADGNSKELRLQTPNGYSLTAFFAVHIAMKVSAEDFKVGYQTPSLAYGAGLVLEMPKCVFHE